MAQEEATKQLYSGPEGYVTVELMEANGRQGALLRYINPNPARMHAIDTQGMLEMEQGVEAISRHPDLQFCIFAGAYDMIHAGADITEFRGEANIDAIHRHLSRGTSLDTKVKALWTRMRTVGVFTGDRYGGSVEWPLFAEWGVCDKDTRIQLTEVHLGIIPGWNGVLNILLKCGPERAKWMGQTGNTLTAEDMLRLGIVQSVVETPDAPSRKDVKPEDLAAAWQKHAEKADPMLLHAALELATVEQEPRRRSEFAAGAAGIAARQELLDSLSEEIRLRTDLQRYRELHDEIARQAAQLRRNDDADGLKALSRTTVKEVNRLGKPLAPLAVRAVGKYVDELARQTHADIFSQYEEVGQMEAELCVSLMGTEHRVKGVNAVLSRAPEDKVPVFD